MNNISSSIDLTMSILLPDSWGTDSNAETKVEELGKSTLLMSFFDFHLNNEKLGSMNRSEEDADFGKISDYSPGIKEAQIDLKIMGVASKNNIKKNESDLRRAADQGDADAANELALKYLWKNQTEASKYLKIAANGGHIEAQNLLGDHNYNGTGIPVNLEEAFKYYKSAADQGHSSAQLNLFSMFQSGNAPKIDAKQAVNYLAMASEKGNTYALFELGKIYQSNSYGIPIDTAKACQYLKEAYQGGVLPALMHYRFTIEKN